MTGFYTNGRGMPQILRQKLPQINPPFYSWRTALLVLVFVCFQFVCLAQESRDNGALKATESIKPLEIGDEIPDELWEAPLQVVNHPEGKEVVTLDEYRGKLIILDFWSTWCSVCVASLPKVNELNSQFDDEVAIIPITTQNSKEIDSYSKKNKSFAGLNPFSIINDSVISSQFPHISMPHIIWINNKGKVLKVAGGTSLSENNISLALKGQIDHIPEKKDNLTFDASLPILINGNGADESFFESRSVITPRINGISSRVSFTRPTLEGDYIRAYVLNGSLLKLYSLVYKRLLHHPINQVKFELKNATSSLEKGFLTDYYCYELLAPVNSLDYSTSKILSDLNYFFGIQVRIENQETTCYSLRKLSSFKPSLGPLKDGFQYLSAWVKDVNKNVNQVPLINDFNEEKLLIPILSSNIQDIDSVNSMLEPYGLIIVEETRSLDYFIISDLKNNTQW